MIKTIIVFIFLVNLSSAQWYSISQYGESVSNCKLSGFNSRLITFVENCEEQDSCKKNSDESGWFVSSCSETIPSILLGDEAKRVNKISYVDAIQTTYNNSNCTGDIIEVFAVNANNCARQGFKKEYKFFTWLDSYYEVKTCSTIECENDCDEAIAKITPGECIDNGDGTSSMVKGNSNILMVPLMAIITVLLIFI